MMYHIRNGKYSSPFTMNISYIFYNRHDDLSYSFKLFNRLGVTQTLSTVRAKQKISAEDRDLQNKIDEMSPATWVYLYDNFNKTYSTYSVVFGDTQTHTVELINRCALALPKPKPCPDERCTKSCVDSCLWNKDRNSELVAFIEIDVNENEQTALETFERERILVSLRETIAVFTYLKKLQTLISADLEEILWNENNETENSFTTSLKIPSWERDNLIDNIQTKLMKRDELRKTYLADKLEHQNSKRIILPAISGKDTDPRAATEILNEGLEKFLDCCNEDDGMFIGGDQKTMRLAMRLKRQHPDTYRNIYVTLTDLHFRKSFMHAVLVRYEELGLKHLARLCGFENQKQWNYLKCVASTHKTFEFFERLAKALRIST